MLPFTLTQGKGQRLHKPYKLPRTSQPCLRDASSVALHGTDGLLHPRPEPELMTTLHSHECGSPDSSMTLIKRRFAIKRILSDSREKRPSLRGVINPLRGRCSMNFFIDIAWNVLSSKAQTKLDHAYALVQAPVRPIGCEVKRPKGGRF
jgi:hypothetical protein